MIDDVAKAHLHDNLCHVRQAVVAKLDGLSEYDIRRPLTGTGTNLLGLVKHLATWESRYLGHVFERPFPEALPRWDDRARQFDNLWATEAESRADIIGFYERVWDHADETIQALPLDAPGHVPWWPQPKVQLFNVLVHLIAETNRHAGHADILREQLDGRTGHGSEDHRSRVGDDSFWEDHCATIEQAAMRAGTAEI